MKYFKIIGFKKIKNILVILQRKMPQIKKELQNIVYILKKEFKIDPKKMLDNFYKTFHNSLKKIKDKEDKKIIEDKIQEVWKSVIFFSNGKMISNASKIDKKESLKSGLKELSILLNEINSQINILDVKKLINCFSGK